MKVVKINWRFFYGTTATIRCDGEFIYRVKNTGNYPIDAHLFSELIARKYPERLSAIADKRVRYINGQYYLDLGGMNEVRQFAEKLGIHWNKISDKSQGGQKNVEKFEFFD